MNISNYFNKKLYLQGIKRLRVTGIVSFVCLSIIAIIAPIIDNLNYGGFSAEIDEITSVVKEAVEYKTLLIAATSSYSFLYAVLFLIVPIMCIILFKFLNSRNGSDFYHSIPTKRRAIYLSFLAAIITWAFFLILGTSVIMGIMYAALPGHIVINGSSIIIYTCNIFISCLLVAAVFGLGCSLSGTFLSNIVTSLSILFLPRLFLTLFCTLISNTNSMLSTDGMFILTRYQCNMVFDGIFRPLLDLVNYNINDYVFGSFNYSTLYTFILAIIYIVVGCIAFIKRPSEVAGQSAVSSKQQFIIRLLLGYTISFIIVIPMYLIVNKDDYFFGGISAILYLILIYAGIFAAMFVYELLTTKKLKSAVKSLISAPLVIVADLATIFILGLLGQYAANYCPDAEDVSYIKFSFNYNTYVETLTSDVDGYLYESSGFYVENDTIRNGISEVEFTDPIAIQYAMDLLEQSIQRISKFDDYYYHDYFNYDYYYDVELTIGEGLFETDRYLVLSSSELENVIQFIANHEKTKALYSSFPSSDDTYVYVEPINSLTNEESLNIYNAFIEDLKNISPTDYHHYAHYSYRVCDLFFDYFDNGKVYYNTAYVSEHTPTAMALYLQYTNTHSKSDFESICEKLKTNPDTLNSHANIGITDFTTGKTTYYYEYLDDIDDHFKFIEPAGKMIDSFNASDYSDFMNIDWNKYYLAKMVVSYYEEYTVDEEAESYSKQHHSYYYFLIEKDSLSEEFLSNFESDYNENFYIDTQN